jgi:hypothetical protein
MKICAHVFNMFETYHTLPLPGKHVNMCHRTSCDFIPRVPASHLTSPRSIPGPERSYGTLLGLQDAGREECLIKVRPVQPCDNRLFERSEIMKISTVWGASKTSRKRKRTVLKPKIRWDVLGLQDPHLEGPSVSIEDIRRQVTSLASRGLGPGTRSRSSAKISPDRTPSNATAPIRKRRRGATE